MYNNDVTYDKKWDTPENRKALKKLQDKYFERSLCSPDCPVAWAPEVLELLTTLDKELGIARNESSYYGYRTLSDKDILKGIFLILFFKVLFNGIIYHVKNTINPDKYYRKKSILKIIESCYSSAIQTGIISVFRAIKVRYINPILNKILKPKIHLSQVKEKYGMLVLYTSQGAAFDKWVEEQIKKTEVLLSKKGAYYPLHQLWTYSSSSSLGADDIEIEATSGGFKMVKRTLYREIMSNMGLNLEEIAQKAKENEKVQK